MFNSITNKTYCVIVSGFSKVQLCMSGMRLVVWGHGGGGGGGGGHTAGGTSRVQNLGHITCGTTSVDTEEEAITSFVKIMSNTIFQSF